LSVLQMPFNKNYMGTQPLSGGCFFINKNLVFSPFHTSLLMEFPKTESGNMNSRNQKFVEKN
jgi:hypothetical protein